MTKIYYCFVENRIEHSGPDALRRLWLVLILFLLFPYTLGYLEARRTHRLVRCGNSWWECGTIGDGHEGADRATNDMLDILYLPYDVAEVIFRNLVSFHFAHKIDKALAVPGDRVTSGLLNDDD